MMILLVYFNGISKHLKLQPGWSSLSQGRNEVYFSPNDLTFRT